MANENVIDASIVVNTESLDAAGPRAEREFNNIAKTATQAGYFLQTFSDASLQAAAAQEQLAAAAASAAAEIPAVVPAAESASFSFTKLWASAREAALGIKESMAEAGASVAEFAETTKLGTATAISSFSALGAILGGGIIVHALGEMFDKARENVINFNQLSVSTGISIEKLVGLRQTMTELDVPTDNLGVAMLRLTRAMDAARDPSSKQAEAFRELGVSTKGWAQELPSPIDPLIQIAHHMANSTKAAEDLGNASTILGRGSQQLAFGLKQVGDELPKLIEGHKGLSAAIDGSTDAADRLQHIESKIGEEWNTFTTSILPAYVGILGSLNVRWLEVNEAVQLGIQLLSLFTNIATISLSAVGGFLKGVAFEALAVASALNMNAAAAIEFQTKAGSAFRLSKAELQGLKSVQENFAQDVIDIGIRTQAKIDAIWAQPPKRVKNTGEDNTDFENRKQEDRIRSAAEARLKNEEAHQLALITIQKIGLEEQEKNLEIDTVKRENLLAGLGEQEAKIKQDTIAKIRALYVNDPESVAKIAELEGQKVAAIDKAAEARAQANVKIAEANQKSIEETRKITDLAEREFDKRTLDEIKALDFSRESNSLHSLEIAADHFKVNQMLEVGELEHQVKMLEYQEQQALAAAKIARASAAQQIAIVHQYDAAISAAKDKLSALQTAQVNPNDTDAESKKTEIAIKNRQRQEAGAQDSARKIQGINAETEKSFDLVFNRISSQFDQSLRGLLQGTQTFGQAFSRMAGNLVTDTVSALLKMELQWAAHEIKKLVMHATTNEGIVASDASAAAQSTAITAAQSFKQILHFAAVAAAKAYASLADIPVVGPALGAAAAAATFVGVLAFQALISAEHGAVLGNSGALAQLHPNEMVLPARLSEGIQRMVNNGGASGQSDSGQSRGHTLHYHAAPGTTDAQMKRDAKKMKRYLDNEDRKRRPAMAT